MLVFDSSVAVKLLFPEAGTPEALHLARRTDLIAPDLLIAEVCNVAWVKSRSGQLHGILLAAVPGVLVPFFQRFVAAQLLAGRALAIADQLSHPIYDCFFLALSQAEAIPLVTADRRFLSRVSSTPWATTVHDLMAPGTMALS